MKRTSITIPDELAYALEREAHRRETSASDVVRESLVAYLGLAPGAERARSLIGIFDGDSTLSEEVATYTAEHIAEHIARENQ